MLDSHKRPLAPPAQAQALVLQSRHQSAAGLEQPQGLLMVQLLGLVRLLQPPALMLGPVKEPLQELAQAALPPDPA